jgi:hypothetical protein
MGKHAVYDPTYIQGIKDIIIITGAKHRGFILPPAIRSIWGCMAWWLEHDPYTAEVLSQTAVAAREYLWCMNVSRYLDDHVTYKLSPSHG